MPNILIPIVTCMAGSNRYKPWQSLSAGRTELKPDYTYTKWSDENRIMPMPNIQANPDSLTRRI
jgi:hypothetical protein